MTFRYLISLLLVVFLAGSAGAQGAGPVADEIGPDGIGSLDVRSGYLFAVNFNNHGGSIGTLKLTDYFATVADKQAFEKTGDLARYEAVRVADPQKYHGHYSLLNPITYNGMLYLPMATRSIQIYLPSSGTILSTRLDDKTWGRVPYEASESDVQGARFAFRLLGKDDKPLVRLVKTFEVRKNSYSLQLTLAVENLSAEAIQVTLDQGGATGVPREDPQQDMRNVTYGRYDAEGKAIQVQIKGLGDIAKVNLGEEQFVGSSDDPGGAVVWLGETNKFFASAMYLRPTSLDKQLNAASCQARFYFAGVEESPTSRTFLTGVRVGVNYRDGAETPGLLVEPGKVQRLAFDIFTGPKKRDSFTEASAPHYDPLYQKLNYLGLINLQGGCFCAWDWLTLGMMWLLQKLAWLSFGNYGVAIILLVLLVRLALHPLTKKSQISMSRMQKLGPAIEELKKKYADDKDTLQKEMMKFYKQQGATPILGCLPMFLQMPIWIALWTGLNASVELRQAAFLPFWLTNMAAPDALLTFERSYPMIGNSFNLLPILLTIAMFLQSKLNPSSMGATAMTPEQQKQQKLMLYMMPGMMLLFFYSTPSGLSLYVMTSTFAGVIEQYIIKKHIAQRDAQKAAAEVVIDGPGKFSRSNRPKKPKGPFWTKK